MSVGWQNIRYKVGAQEICVIAKLYTNDREKGIWFSVLSFSGVRGVCVYFCHVPEMLYLS